MSNKYTSNLPISICIIAKNEEKNLHRFLSSIRKHFAGYPHEIIFVDTGSTDKTVDIAKEYQCKVFHFEWMNDFSAARNYSLNCATYDWVLVLDCDEFIVKSNPKVFQAIAKEYPKGVGVLTRFSHYELNESDSTYKDLVERFFNRKYFHYEFIIHEQVRAIDGTPYERIALPLTVDHYGYTGTEDDLHNKALRNNNLLLKMLEDTPDDPYLYFQLGQSYNMIHDDEKACYYYGKGLEYDIDPKLEYVQMMVNGYGYALLHLGKYEEALLFENIYEEFSDNADFICLMGQIYLKNGNILQAMQQFLLATTFDDARVTGANSFIPRYNMGCINEVLGDTEAAISLYEKCGEFAPAKERLAELKQKK